MPFRRHAATPPPGVGRLTSLDGSVILTPASGKGSSVDLSVPPSSTGLILPATTPPAGTYSCCAVAANGNWIIGSTAVGLVTSTDKGNTWGAPFATNGFGPRCLYAKGNTVLAVGASNAAQLSLCYSTDGGATWTGPLVVNGAASALSNGQTRAAMILGAAWWVVSGNNFGTIYKSTNNGVTWVDQSGSLVTLNPWGIDTDGAANILVTGTYTVSGTTSAWNVSTNSGTSFALAQAAAMVSTAVSPAVFGNDALVVCGDVAPTAHIQMAEGNPYTAGSSNNGFPQIVSAPITPRVFNANGWAVGGKYAGGYNSIAFTVNGGLLWKGLSPFIGQCTDLAFVSASELIAVGTGGPGPLVIVTGLN